MVETLEVVLRLGLAVLLGGVVGLEREALEKPAGFRTHILVALGATLFTLISGYGFRGSGADPTRIAANVVVGIGFLGAGTIWRHGVGVGGLTTAASLWTVAAIGMAVGTGLYLPAILGTLAVVVILHLFPRIDARLLRRGSTGVLQVAVQDRPGRLADLFGLLARHRATVLGAEVVQGTDGLVHLTFTVRTPPEVDRGRLLAALLEADGVHQARWMSS
ncbi:MAG: MgtC/SapB family protein [Armatimonadota bacterium]|nr:MgtC/SapB family protein [Armatimonadota bacterium]MDR7439555.1 MgtC/SapB family protein [Armatimonadota bacterium]MDR7443785.1 MgtC/SapB family protein [Armatimonadota bacterium]MDR7569045.1 MgtC/SapB family protein [Armatimonadota bacterium]MDR7613934.1 MgtC/SapB family protein [Armatimonadota bacterium]